MMRDQAQLRPSEASGALGVFAYAGPGPASGPESEFFVSDGRVPNDRGRCRGLKRSDAPLCIADWTVETQLFRGSVSASILAFMEELPCNS
jgi:hypothetical protein